MTGFVWNGSVWERQKQLSLWNGSAWEEVGSAWHWYNGAWERLYVKPLLFSDNFNRSNQYLDASANWVQYTNGTSTYRSYISSNVVSVFHNTTDSTTPSWARWVNPTASDHQFVQATVTSTNTTHNSWLTLGMSSDLQTWIGVQIGGDASGIYSTTNGGSTITQRASATNSTSASQVWRLERLGNVYTAFRSGTQIAQFDNSGGTVAGTGRYVGLGTTRRRAAFVNSQSPNLDDWSAGDL